jgi:uncharacterized membrane protein
MTSRLAAWAAASLVTMGLDLLWLGILARGFYRREVGHLMADRVLWPAALAFYLLYGGGVLYFCTLDALRGGGLRTALLRGALLGLLAYGTYDLTNMAVLKDWGARIAAADILWGIVLTATASAAAYAAARAIR